MQKKGTPMGIDTRIYCKTNDGNEPALCDSLPNGAYIIAAGEWGPDGATHEINQGWRYYAPGYERGPWPLIAAALLALHAAPNVETVWYFGDTSETGQPFTPELVHEYSTHYMANGDRPYRNR
jgi:hypothetical protein